MSCPKDTNLTIKDEFGNLIAPIVKRISKCKGRLKQYPSFTPIINNISVNISISSVYTVVYISGANFLPPCNGNTYVNFGSYTNLPIVFYNSSFISFVVPLNVPAGYYNIQVVNVYNDNFALPVAQSYPGIPNYSNSITYLIISLLNKNGLTSLLLKLYSLSGSFILSKTNNYENIITFTGDGNLNFLQQYNKNINFVITMNGKSITEGIINKGNNNVTINENTIKNMPFNLYDYPGQIIFKSKSQISNSLNIIFYFNS